MNTTNYNTVWYGLDTLYISVKEGESRQQVIVLDHAIDKTTLTLSLDGRDATLDCVIILLADQVDIPLDIIIRHTAPCTRSKIMVRSVARDHSRILINGTVQCLKGSDKSIAQFSHHALHLSDDVQTRTIPSLEIKAEDVNAKHAVSVGYFNQQAIWYGQTRGVTKSTIMTEMAKGFVVEDLQALPTSVDIAPALSTVASFMTVT
ncbi:MAG: SufD family Fe-S cluster assembly protein [bacterium]|nr:SufD family Fe-S cluster assembly protein [bacterium]